MPGVGSHSSGHVPRGLGLSLSPICSFVLFLLPHFCFNYVSVPPSETKEILLPPRAKFIKR